MNPISKLAHRSIRCFSVSNHCAWKLPVTDQDFERYLMRYENVVGNPFLESMRDQYVKFGIKFFSDKQKQGIRNCVSHGSTRLRRVNSIHIIKYEISIIFYNISTIYRHYILNRLKLIRS